MTNTQTIIKYLKRMGCEKGGVVINEEELKKALNQIRQETLEEMMYLVNVAEGENKMIPPQLLRDFIQSKKEKI